MGAKIYDFSSYRRKTIPQVTLPLVTAETFCQLVSPLNIPPVGGRRRSRSHRRGYRYKQEQRRFFDSNVPTIYAGCVFCGDSVSVPVGSDVETVLCHRCFALVELD